MSKTKTERETKKPTAAAKDAAKDAAPADGGWRETVESVAMAVILALLFRGFVAEAFVIPTGSMAPTLDGRHKDVWCSKCGVQYQVSASDENREDRITGFHVSTTTCPICRYTQTLDPINRPNDGSFSGDRVIVGKFCYDLAEPKRWDVIVFKYPQGAVQNYIKRLIGLPGEKIRIVGGNIYTCGKDEPNEALRIARKPPNKLDELLQIVDDTDHIPKELTDIGWPSRWQAAPTAAASPWQVLDGGRAFVCAGGQSEEAWLRYRNLIPSYADWQTIELDDRLPAGVADRQGELIADYYAYNTPHYIRSDTISAWRSPRLKAYRPPAGIRQQPGPGEPPNSVDVYRDYILEGNIDCFGQHWVDDLALECLADATGNQGELTLLLVRAGVHHLCKINLADGKATLSMVDPAGRTIAFAGDDGKPVASPTAQTNVRGPGKYRLRLSNCDHEILLWVNGSVVSFDGPTTYDSEGNNDLPVPYYSASDPGDLAPAGVASRGAAVKLSQLRIYRDKYYIAINANNTDYDRAPPTERIHQIFRDPTQWSATEGLFADGNRGHEQFLLDQDQFLPLGDNSPQSSDARFWGGHHYVERDLLIGKALLIYWPHTWNSPLPFTPNFRRMGPIR